MELINWDGLSLGSIIAGLVPTPILYFAGRFFSWCARNKAVGHLFFSARSSFITRISLLTSFSIMIGYALSVISLKAFGWNISGTTAAVTFLIASLISIQFLFAKVGLHSAELSVASGTDYTASLNLCRNYFWFLGTGASKLTSSKPFRDTVIRCSSTSKIRFLLSAPDNKIIRDAELRADAVPDAYRHGIIKSLRVLKELREERRADFEVRFYSGVTERDYENFRMFFVDDRVLLLSYNVYGQGDGRQTPQLVIRKGLLSGETEGFYHAYRSYYERLWRSSREWDFKEYL